MYLDNTSLEKVNFIIEFNANFFKDIDIDQIYREQRYVQIKTQLKSNKVINIIYVDFKINIFIINYKLKKRDLLDAYTYLITILTRIRGIKNNIYKINKYIIYKIYLFNKKNKNKRIIIIKIT